jgi:hypothetical protein
MSDFVEPADVPPIEPIPIGGSRSALAVTDFTVPVLEPAESPGRFRRALRAPLTLLRFLVRRAIWILIRLIRGAWRYPIVALGLALLVFLGYRAYQDYYVTKPPPPATPQFQLVEAIPPADAVLTYLKAQQTFDAKAMWDSYSARAQTQNLQQGATLQTLQQEQQSLQQEGLSFGDSAYVGGYKLNNGRAYYFYVTKVQASGLNAEVYQTFFVDTDGKILEVDAPQLASQ